MERQKQRDEHTAFFYCRSDDNTTLTSLSILKGLLTQQVQWHDELLQYFYEQRLQKGEPVLNAESTAKQLVKTVALRPGRQYIILDGLDECPWEERKNILSFLTSLIADIEKMDPSKVRLLVISQKEPDIRKLLQCAEEFELNVEDTGRDIAFFVGAWVCAIRDKFELPKDGADFLEWRTCKIAAGKPHIVALSSQRC